MQQKKNDHQKLSSLFLSFAQKNSKNSKKEG